MAEIAGALQFEAGWKSAFPIFGLAWNPALPFFETGWNSARPSIAAASEFATQLMLGAVVSEECQSFIARDKESALLQRVRRA